MAVGSSLILPRISPVGGGADDGQGCMSNSWFSGGRLDQEGAIVSRSQPTQSKFSGGDRINPCRKVSQTSANQVQLDFVESAGTGGGAKINSPPGILSLT